MQECSSSWKMKILLPGLCTDSRMLHIGRCRQLAHVPCGWEECLQVAVQGMWLPWPSTPKLEMHPGPDYGNWPWSNILAPTIADIVLFRR